MKRLPPGLELGINNLPRTLVYSRVQLYRIHFTLLYGSATPIVFFRNRLIADVIFQHWQNSSLRALQRARRNTALLHANRFAPACPLRRGAASSSWRVANWRGSRRLAASLIRLLANTALGLCWLCDWIAARFRA